jgi:hypothetical protein
VQTKEILMKESRVASLVLVAATATLVGFATGQQPAWPAVVLAQACGLHAACNFGDSTRTSSLTVDHVTTGGAAVEPNTGETWSVTATWALQTIGSACDCANRTANATVDVDWTGSGWTATCTAGCNPAGPIVGVAICNNSNCGAVANPTIGYELLVDLTANAVFQCFGANQTGKLVQVDYQTSSVDNGNPITNNTTCALGSSVSPTSQTWTTSDTGTFECDFTCAGASGPSVTIQYQ